MIIVLKYIKINFPRSSSSQFIFDEPKRVTESIKIKHKYILNTDLKIGNGFFWRFAYRSSLVATCFSFPILKLGIRIENLIKLHL